MTRSPPRPARKPKTTPAPRAESVFRAFVRQLERLDPPPRREGGR